MTLKVMTAEERKAARKAAQRTVTSRTVLPKSRTYWVQLQLACGHSKLISAGTHPEKYGLQRTARCDKCYFADHPWNTDESP